MHISLFFFLANWGGEGRCLLTENFFRACFSFPRFSYCSRKLPCQLCFGPNFSTDLSGVFALLIKWPLTVTNYAVTKAGKIWQRFKCQWNNCQKSVSRTQSLLLRDNDALPVVTGPGLFNNTIVERNLCAVYFSSIGQSNLRSGFPFIVSAKQMNTTLKQTLKIVVKLTL